MPAKSPEVKATEKKITEEQKIANEVARRDRARQVVAGAKYIGNFRIMDADSEILLQIATDAYNGNDSNLVAVNADAVPKHLADSLAFQAEKLQQYGAIVNYLPYGRSVMLTLSTEGKAYCEEKASAEEKLRAEVESRREQIKMRTEIFISHRTVDAPVADMIKDFLVATGIPNNQVFCSSLPGNDVNEKIGPEVKEHLKNATINILILSADYYKSAYCINEAGVAWYLDDALAIPIGLPEIDHKFMVGFLNDDYKLRRLNDDGDISYLYDQAQERLGVVVAKHGVITRETQKLKERYQKYIEGREERGAEESSLGESNLNLVRVTSSSSFHA